jgi:2-dehydropantoate 2-reductase
LRERGLRIVGPRAGADASQVVRPKLGPAFLAEASAVAAAAGYPIPADALASTTQTITQAGSPVDSSLSRDVADGRPAEVDEALAHLARRGAEHGVKTPLFDLATMQLRVFNNGLRPSR